MNKSYVDVMNRGMQCLVERLGIVEAEQFIYLVKAEQFNYTDWQRRHFDDMDRDEMDAAMLEYAQMHPFQGDASAII